jgi:hypothetical protein
VRERRRMRRGRARPSRGGSGAGQHPCLGGGGEDGSSGEQCSGTEKRNAEHRGHSIPVLGGGDCRRAALLQQVSFVRASLRRVARVACVAWSAREPRIPRISAIWRASSLWITKRRGRSRALGFLPNLSLRPVRSGDRRGVNGLLSAATRQRRLRVQSAARRDARGCASRRAFRADRRRGGSLGGVNRLYKQQARAPCA